MTIYVHIRTLCLLLLYFCLLLHGSSDLIAQSPDRHNIFSYNVNEGLLQSTIGDLAIDQNNACWIGFPNGIQKFDGKSFTNIPPQAGLPDTKNPEFIQCNNKELLISHRFGISKYDILKNTFIELYKYKLVAKYPARIMGEYKGHVYFFTDQARILCLNSTDYSLVSEVNSHLPSFRDSSILRPGISSNILAGKLVFSIDKRLYLWDFDAGKVIATSETIPQLSGYTLYLTSMNEVLFLDYSNQHSIQRYHFINKTISPVFIKGKDSSIISRFHIFKWKNKLMISFNNRLYETNEQFSQLTSEIVDFQNKPVSLQNAFSMIVEDHHGNLYLSTITSGIRKVIGHNYPIRYFGSPNTGENFSISVFADKKHHHVLTGSSGNGLFVFDTAQKLIKHYPRLPGLNRDFSPNVIFQSANGDYWMFCGGVSAGYILSRDLSKIQPVPFFKSYAKHRFGVDYFGNLLYQDNRIALLQSQGHIYKIEFASKRITEYEFTSDYTHSGIFHHGVIISHTADELLFIDTSNFEIQKRIPFPNTAGVRCFTKDKEGNIYAGSNNGIYKIDLQGKILGHFHKDKGLPDNCIYAMAFDDKGNLWCSSNKGIFKWKDNRVLLQLKREDGLQENEFNTNGIYVAPDGEIYFAGVNGVSSFYPDQINDYREKMNLLVTGIRINNQPIEHDTAVWNIKSIQLPYFKNALSFDFIVTSNNNPSQYVYQYKMEGVDNNWIMNDDMQTVRYHLQPGKYTFKMYASRSFDSNATPLKSISIYITPPFWKTWWFILVGSLAILGLLVFIINLYNKRRFEKKLRILEAEQKVKQERERISRDLHDSLGAYANAVLYNTELLQNETGEAERENLIKDLRFASKDIITSLRETIWALKKEHYTASDCLLRIRNFIQPFNRYYPHIHFKVEGEAPANRILHYAKALHLVRMIQEAVSNAIKHANATDIIMQSKNGGPQWTLTITDNGKGFTTPISNSDDGGNGLLNMQQRAKDAGFAYSIHSSPGEGTQVEIIVV